MRSITCLVVVLAVTPFSGVISQEHPPPIEPGARVRVWAPDLGVRKQVGALVRDFVLLSRNGRGKPLAIPLASVTRVQVSPGRKSNWLLGMGIGFLAGASIGALAGASADCKEAGLNDEASCIGLGAATGAVLGLFVGTIVGALTKTDRWEEVPLDRLRMSFTPQRNGRFGLSMSVGF